MNPIPIKAALNLMGHQVGGHRLPMVEPSKEELAQIRSCLERSGLLAAASAPSGVYSPAQSTRRRHALSVHINRKGLLDLFGGCESVERSLLNLGILAHVDAGKTTLTERLLFEAGVIAEPGSVDAGTTQTDTLALERQRGITIKAAVVSFPLGDDLTVNLVDTPGHPDFIAEVERALGVLDGAVLVVSAVEGVQSQTRILWRALERLRVPTIFFVNKTDRMGARLSTASTARSGSGSRRGRCRPDDVEAIAEQDEETLSAYVEGRPVDVPAALRRLHAVFYRLGADR